MPEKQGEEEWTFVSTSRNRQRKNHHRNKASKGGCHNHDHHVAPNLGKKSGLLSRQEKKIAKAQEIQSYLLSSNSSESNNNNYDYTHKNKNVTPNHSKNSIGENGPLDGERDVIVDSIMKCIDSLESTEFARRCFHLIIREASRKGGIGEIICYGIGNFSAMPMYSASMLQLAFAILIRKWSSMLTDDNKMSKEYDDHYDWYEQYNNKNNNNIVSWEDQQKQMKIRYFEPFMNTMERSILEQIFHVDILEKNERGKRSIDDNTTTTTLFFMPHCPMRLYTNVLWANWGDSLLRTIIFGNSFTAYDDRTMDSTIRRDPTNGIFRALSFLKEQEWNSLVSKDNAAKKKLTLASLEDGAALNHLEKAFNDCVITSFHTTKGSHNSFVWPERPQEYQFQPDGNVHGEVI